MAACGRGEAAPGPAVSRAAIEDISAQITNIICNLQLMQFMQGLHSTSEVGQSPGLHSCGILSLLRAPCAMFCRDVPQEACPRGARPGPRAAAGAGHADLLLNRH